MADRFNEHLSCGPYGYATALFNYDGDYERITQALKYDGNIAAGRHFSRMLASEIAAAPHFKDVDAVIPVPLHWTRRLSRGYNQAEIIAREVAAALGVPCLTSALKRVRRTKTQTKVSVEEKSTNVASAFKADPSALAGLKHLLLIDDVFTTGSTLGACAAAIREAIDQPAAGQMDPGGLNRVSMPTATGQVDPGGLNRGSMPAGAHLPLSAAPLDASPTAQLRISAATLAVVPSWR